MIHYEGMLDETSGQCLMDMIMMSSVSERVKRKDTRKWCALAIELIDNAIRYNTTDHISFYWEMNESGLVMRLKNTATAKDAERLRDSVERLKAMTPEELETEFRAQMLNGEFGDKGGAGLGMIQIIRKGVRSLEVVIVRRGEDHYICETFIDAKPE
jgi:hypothetical protein